MKIDPSLSQAVLPPSVENRTSQHNTARQVKPEQTDVTLSPLSSQLKQLDTQLSAIPVVDRARVESIKEAIAGGQYTINTGNIAGNLIDSVKELLHASK